MKFENKTHLGELFVAGRATAVGGDDNFYVRYNGVWSANISESFVATYCDVTVGIEKAAVHTLTPATINFLASTGLRLRAFRALREPEPDSGSSENVTKATLQEIQTAKRYGV